MRDINLIIPCLFLESYVHGMEYGVYYSPQLHPDDDDDDDDVWGKDGN